MWHMGNTTIPPGEKRSIDLDFGMKGCAMPATAICGAEHGKTLLVVAGSGGGRYPGILASMRVAQSIDPKRMRGNALFIHCADTAGFWQRDDSAMTGSGSLLYDFPGDPAGTMQQRVAHYISEVILPSVDFVVDLRSGGASMCLTPCLFFPRRTTSRRKALEAAAAMDIPYLVQSSLEGNLVCYAANAMGIPGVWLERGHSGLCQPEWVDAYVRDIQLLMNHLGIYAFSGGAVCQKRMFAGSETIRAKEQGLWLPDAKENMYMRKGELLGRMIDFEGNVLNEYCADRDVLVLLYTTALAVQRGDVLALWVDAG